MNDNTVKISLLISGAILLGFIMGMTSEIMRHREQLRAYDVIISGAQVPQGGESPLANRFKRGIK